MLHLCSGVFYVVLCFGTLHVMCVVFMWRCVCVRIVLSCMKLPECGRGQGDGPHVHVTVYCSLDLMLRFGMLHVVGMVCMYCCAVLFFGVVWCVGFWSILLCVWYVLLCFMCILVTRV
jgi:hypothetical protein